MNGSFASRNVGALVKNVNGGGGRFVAAGAGDNTKITGQTIDRAIAGGGMFLSAAIAVLGRAVLTATETLKFALEYQTSADGSSWDTAVPIYAATTVATGGGGGTTEFATKESDLDLSSLKRYVRFNATPDLSAGATDVGEIMVNVTLGGADITPV